MRSVAIYRGQLPKAEWVASEPVLSMPSLLGAYAIRTYTLVQGQCKRVQVASKPVNSQEQAKRRRSQAVLDDLRGKSGNMDARQVDAALRRQLGHLGLVRNLALGLLWPLPNEMRCLPAFGGQEDHLDLVRHVMRHLGFEPGWIPCVFFFTAPSE